MSRIVKIACCSIFSLVLSCAAVAQSQWPTPEVEQLYQQARQYLSQGNTRQAIVTYQQVIQIAPSVMVPYRELAQAYYLTGEYEKAQEILEPILKNDAADEQVYQLMSLALMGQGEEKKARNMLQDGIKRFPNSGLLYHEMGMLYEAKQETEYALQTWLDGIEKDPSYHVNYYDAARTYMYTNKIVWAILYAEMFINMEHHTPRANETRKMLVAAYKRLFNTADPNELPKFGKGSSANSAPKTFEEAVYKTFMRLAPVVSDGITTENLTMLRTRFVMDWLMEYGNQYNHSLFYRFDNMLRNGSFDAYNQWLFGKAENMQQFDAWVKFHPQAVPEFEAWIQKNPYRPSAADFYNDKETRDIFLIKR